MTATQRSGNTEPRIHPVPAPIRIRECGADESGSAQRYAEQLLIELNIEPLRDVAIPRRHPALAWAQSGLMTLAGSTAGAPQILPTAFASCADGVLAALASLAPENELDNLEGSRLLAERAALTHHTRAGAVSPNGACRLLDAADGTLALNLPRAGDWELVGAWLEAAELADAASDWTRLQEFVRPRVLDDLVERGRMLGLAVSVAWHGSPLECDVPNLPAQASLQITSSAERVRAPSELPRAPRVLDLSALWAGPLCSNLLERLGADVVKVESVHRPDGARSGSTAFFDLLNGGKRSVALDFHKAEGRRQLQALLQRADIVIEGSRPRALRQLGVDTERLLHERIDLSWISVTGYGRDEPCGNWIAFGDDAGVAGGLSALMAQVSGSRFIVGDAIADPLTGLHAALVAWAGYLRKVMTGRGAGLVSLPLSGVVDRCAAFETPSARKVLRDRWCEWQQRLRDGRVEAATPRARSTVFAARPLGADNASVFADWDIAC